MVAKAFDRFLTIGAAKANARRILGDYEDHYYEPITGRDATDVTAMLRNHPDALSKIGPGIRYHFVAPDDYGSHGFRTLRSDGTEVVWSYPIAISGKPRAWQVQLRMALRDEIRPLMDMVRLVPGGEVHHDGPWNFALIADAFLFDMEVMCDCIKPEEMLVERAGVGVSRLVDRALAARWIEYHNSVARLVVLSRSEHLARTLEQIKERVARQ